jgi:hypothetical protein
MIETKFAYLKAACDRLFKVEMQINNPSVQSVYAPTTLFVITILFYVVYQLAMEPSWVLGGGMWAEMATNYFPNANSSSYFQKLFATDSGYIPAPQRLIALAGNVLNLPASSIPYLYTWSAIIVTGMMVGTFCLSRFRTLVKSDALRFLTAISILVVADFGTRVFINFTYFAAFFVAITTALTMVDESEESPWWAWFIPVLMVSKPAVLTVLPAMIFVSIIVNKSRFNWVTIATVALCMVQLSRMIVSQKTGTMSQHLEIPLSSKLMATGQYFFGLLGGYIVGPNFHLNKYSAMLAGGFFVSASGMTIYQLRSKANFLIIVGLSLLFFNVLLNTFALKDSWNTDLAQLISPPDSHIIVGFSGCVLVVVGMVSSLTNFVFSELKSSAVNSVVALVFAAWFAGTGWLSLGGKMSREPGFPMINNSQWQNMARAVDSGVSPLCVPIDPLGWMYSRDCTLLNQVWMQDFHFKQVQTINDTVMLAISPPGSISEKTLISLGVLVRPLSTQTNYVAVKAIIQLRDGSKEYYTGNRELDITGGLILLTGQDSIPIMNISSIKFIFSSPVEIALTTNELNSDPEILWMGS